jgi:CheY-like chemotaxis protein
MPSTAERLDHERRGTVLVVAGDELRAEVAEALAGAGYRVVTLGNTTDAAAFLRRQTVQPALIVLDWSAPGMSGLQFIAFHASSPLYSRTPVAVIAAPGNNVPRLCVVGIVYRPVDHDRLAEIVERATRIVPRRDAFERDLALS